MDSFTIAPEHITVPNAFIYVYQGSAITTIEQMGNWGTEKLSDLFSINQETCNGARIWTPATQILNSCSNHCISCSCSLSLIGNTETSVSSDFLVCV